MSIGRAQPFNEHVRNACRTGEQTVGLVIADLDLSSGCSGWGIRSCRCTDGTMYRGNPRYIHTSAYSLKGYKELYRVVV